MRTSVLSSFLCVLLFIAGCGSDGSDGEPGANGMTGAQGIKGDPGDNGDPGEDGEPGTRGAMGAMGEPGDDGEQGDRGVRGPKGTMGEPGDDGDDGDDSLIVQTPLELGDENCWLGGLRIDSGLDLDDDGILDATEIDDTNALCQPNTFSEHGVVLPYSVLRNDLDNAANPGSTFEIRNGGFGSDAARHPENPMQFYALTDRGPNADYTGANGAGKIFAVRDYTPRIGLFEVEPNGTVAHLDTILLRDDAGAPISGLPNPVYGATNEVPYDADGEIIRVDMNAPYDAGTNPYDLDPYGLDSEGLVAVSDGTFWVSDEYGPHIVHYDSDGTEIERINPFVADARNTLGVTLPAELGRRRANRGMEGLTITPDESTLVGIMQSSISNPTGAVNNNDLTRIVTVNLDTLAVSQYLYRQEIKHNSNSAIVALSATSFLIIERDGAFYAQTPTAMKHIYKITLTGATDLETIATGGDFVQDPASGLLYMGQTLEQVAFGAGGWDTLETAGIVPVEKELLVDMVAEVSYPHDKMEGLWLIDEHRLGVLNDDDFALWSSANALEQKYLDATKRIDGNTLYVIEGLDLSGN